MIFSNLPDTVQIHHPVKTTDEYGNPALEFNSDSTVTIVKGWLQREQGIGGESNNAERSLSSALFRLFLSAGTKIDARDRVQIDGITYTVEGEPTVVRGLRGTSHIKARVQRLQG